MKKRTAVIGALVSLLPLGQPLVIGKGAVLTSAGLILAIPDQAQAETADFYYNRGIEKQDKGDYYGAISDYTKAIKINPRDAEAYHNRASAKESLNDYEGALKDYEKAVHIDPSDLSYQGVGVTKNALGDHYGAISAYNKSIKINKRNADVYYNRANTKGRDLEDYYGAISDYNKAIEIKPNYVFAYSNRGFAKKLIGDMKGACSDWRKASSLGSQKSAKRVRNQC